MKCMETSTAIMTAVSGLQIAAAGSILEDTKRALRVELTFVDHPDSLEAGKYYRLDSGDECIICELLTYRWSAGNARLLLGVVHRVQADALKALAAEYEVQFQPVEKTPALGKRPATRRYALLGSEMHEVIARFRLTYTTVEEAASRAPRLAPREPSPEYLFLREMVNSSPPA